MLDLETCKTILGDTNLTDEQIIEIRKTLYILVETIVYDNND